MKPYNNLPTDEDNLSTLSEQSLPIIPADVSSYACVLHTSENRRQRTPGNSKFCWVLTLFNFKRLTQSVTVLSLIKTQTIWAELPPSYSLKSTCSVTLIIQSSQGTNGSRDKWGSSQRSSENNGSEGRGNNSTKNCWLSSALKFPYSWMEHSWNKISFFKQAFQMIAKTIWQSEELLFILVLACPERDRCCSYCSNFLTRGTAVAALLVVPQCSTSSQRLSKSVIP